jgi:hypothetical protein
VLCVWRAACTCAHSAVASDGGYVRIVVCGSVRWWPAIYFCNELMGGLYALCVGLTASACAHYYPHNTLCLSLRLPSLTHLSYPPHIQLRGDRALQGRHQRAAVRAWQDAPGPGE